MTRRSFLRIFCTAATALMAAGSVLTPAEAKPSTLGSGELQGLLERESERLYAEIARRLCRPSPFFQLLEASEFPQGIGCVVVERPFSPARRPNIEIE